MVFVNLTGPGENHLPLVDVGLPLIGNQVSLNEDQHYQVVCKAWNHL